MAQVPFFVYGTLRPGYFNYAHLLAGKTVQETPATVSGYQMHGDAGRFPWLIPGDGKAVGVLVWVSAEQYESTLASVDALEGYNPDDDSNNLYERVMVEVTAADGSLVDAWLYVTAEEWREEVKEEHALIPSGDWTDAVYADE